MSELRGICTPICTVFTADGSRVDDVAQLVHVDTLLEAGVHIIATCGGTGEFSFLRPEERRHVSEIVARHLQGRARLIVHASAVMTEETIEHAKHAEGLGADALLVLPPYFEGPSLDGVYEHYARVAASVSTPIMAYNIPVHTGIDLTPAFVRKLMEIDGVDYLKDSTADFVRLQQLVAGGVEVFVGGDPLMCHGLMAGASGCFWGMSNAIPAEAVELYRLIEGARHDAALALWRRIWPLNDYVWRNAFNPSVKAAARRRGMDVRECRRPVQPLDAGQLAELDVVMSTLAS